MDAADVPAPGRGELTACTGAVAVRGIERQLCGSGAVTSAAAAEGAVAAGGRAAVLLDARGPQAVGMAPTGAWVHHRLRRHDGGAGGTFAFELLATDAQSAVDHCLIAHRVAETLERPGVCTVEPEVADELALVRLPADPAPQPASTAAPSAANTEAILAIVDDAFAAVAEHTGRPRAAVHREGPAGAARAVVAGGAAWSAARAAAQRLTDAGTDCAAVCVQLLSPGPIAALRACLEGAESIVVLDGQGGAGGQVGLLGLVRAAIADADRAVYGLVRVPPTAADLVDALTAPFGLDAVDLDIPEPSTGSVALAMGALPQGDWGESLLLSATGLLARLVAVEGVHRHAAADVAAVRIDWQANATEPEGLDLLVAAHHGLLDADAARALKVGGVLVLLSEGRAAGTAPALPGAVSSALAERAARVLWLRADDLAPTGRHERQLYLCGAVLAALQDGDHEACREALSRLAGDVGLDAATQARLQAGAAALSPLADPAAAAPVPTGGAPRMPDEPDAEPEAAWTDAVRRFHVTGAGAVSRAEPIGGLPLRPWALSPLVSPDRLRSAYPLVVGEAGVRPFVDFAEELLAAGSFELLPRSVARLAAAVARGAGDGEPRVLAEVFADVRAEFARRLDLSDAARASLETELETFAAALGEERVIGLGPRTLVEILAQAAAAARRSRMHAFHDEVTQLVRRLEECLTSDVGPGARSADRMAASLGGAGLFDTEALARSLPARSGSQPLGEARRQRIEDCLEQLRDFLRHVETRLPDAVLLHPGLVQATSLPAGVRSVPHGAGMDAAAGYFESSARQITDLLRAVRTARLEADGRFRPEHESALERLDWQALRRDELALVPPVFILETTDRVLGASLSSLSSLLRSGRPLHLVLLDPAPGMVHGADAEALASTHVDLGSLAVAHRDATVLQSTLSQPTHLHDGLGRLASSPRPSVAVVATPDWRMLAPPWVQLSAAHESRCTPCFVYDPEGGRTWADRFALQPNPEAGSDWVQVAVQARTDGEERLETSEPFTFAHAAALAPRCRHAFRVLPVEAWGPEQLPIADYLRLPADERVRRVPYLWVVGNDGDLARAVMTREMAHACADRLQAWRALQELAGPAGRAVPATPAAPDAGEPAAVDGPAGSLAPAAPELESLRAQAAAEAMGRLAQALLSTDGGSMMQAADLLRGGASPTTPAAPAGPPATSAAPAAAPAAPAADDGPAELGEPFIDSPLCTSCHDCVNLNPRMFQYDANKQAFLADASKGTYAELVKAAEACPSRCIYPGAPRADDSTATEKLIERARKFA